MGISSSFLSYLLLDVYIPQRGQRLSARPTETVSWGPQSLAHAGPGRVPTLSPHAPTVAPTHRSSVTAARAIAGVWTTVDKSSPGHDPDQDTDHLVSDTSMAYNKWTADVLYKNMKRYSANWAL